VVLIFCSYLYFLGTHLLLGYILALLEAVKNIEFVDCEILDKYMHMDTH
jgi:hypothetical protein